MSKEGLVQLPLQFRPNIESFYPADIRIYPRGEVWWLEKELVSARKEGESRDLCHLSSDVVLEDLETNEKISGMIAGIYCYRLVGFRGKRYQKTSFLFRVKTDRGEEVLYPMWERPENLFLKDAETGRNFHCRG